MAATVVATPTPSPTPTAEALSRADSSQGFCFNHNFMRDNPGKLEDFYDVAKSNLGEGSFGSVALAKCKRTKCERAVKTIDLGTVKNPQRFEHEIAIQRQQLGACPWAWLPSCFVVGRSDLLEEANVTFGAGPDIRAGGSGWASASGPFARPWSDGPNEPDSSGRPCEAKA